jgi:hypothetical protein
MSTTEIKYLTNRIAYLEADLLYHQREKARLEEIEREGKQNG